MISAARHKFIALWLKNDDVIVYVCMSVFVQGQRGFCGKLKRIDSVTGMDIPLKHAWKDTVCQAGSFLTFIILLEREKF